jgi:hypothetical protein
MVTMGEHNVMANLGLFAVKLLESRDPRCLCGLAFRVFSLLVDLAQTKVTLVTVGGIP